MLVIYNKNCINYCWKWNTPSLSNLVKTAEYNTKVTEIENKLNNHNHDKYIDTPEFNKLAADVFNARLAQANLINRVWY